MTRSRFASQEAFGLNGSVLKSLGVAAGHRPALRRRGLLWRMTQGSPAWRANPALKDGIPSGSYGCEFSPEKIEATLSDGAWVCDPQ